MTASENNRAAKTVPAIQIIINSAANFGELISRLHLLPSINNNGAATITPSASAIHQLNHTGNAIDDGTIPCRIIDEVPRAELRIELMREQQSTKTKRLLNDKSSFTVPVNRFRKYTAIKPCNGPAVI